MFLSSISQDSDFSARIVLTKYDDNGTPLVELPDPWEYPGHIAALSIISRMILTELCSKNQYEGHSVSEFDDKPYRANFKTKFGSDDVAFLEYHDAETGEAKIIAKYSAHTLRVYFKTQDRPQYWEYRIARITKQDTPGLPSGYEIMLDGDVPYIAPSLDDALSYIDMHYCKEATA